MDHQEYLKFVGGQIRKIRHQKGLSAKKVADALGISMDYVYRVERGERRICIEELYKFSRLTNISTDVLLDPELQDLSYTTEKT
jgi:transcriptional regulator with XRE-family HTH domain